MARWELIKHDVMAALAEAKYARCPEALRATRTAELWHVVRGHKMRFVHLERLRSVP